MSVPSSWWIDWKLSPGSLVRETAWRLAVFLVLAACFLALVLSGGVDRFLSGRLAITAVLRLSVTEAEGRGIAAKVAGLPAVASAVYKDPEDAWKEFAAAFPGVESLRAAGGGNPLPGYVEIHLRPGSLSEKAVASVEAALRPLPQIDELLSGAKWAPRALRLKRWVNAAFWAAFGLLGAAFFAVFVLQEKARTVVHASDFAFLSERGASSRGMAVRRAAAASLCGAVLALVSLGAAAGAHWLADSRYPSIRSVMGRPPEILAPESLALLGAFLLSAALLSGAASLVGWRAALASRK